MDVQQNNIEVFFELQLSKVIRTFNALKKKWYEENSDYWPTFYLKLNKPPKIKVKTVETVTHHIIQGEVGSLDVRAPINPIITYNPFEVLDVGTQTEGGDDFKQLEDEITQLKKQVDEANSRIMTQSTKMNIQKFEKTIEPPELVKLVIEVEKSKRRKKRIIVETKEVIKEVVIPVIKEEHKQVFVQQLVDLNKISNQMSKKLDRDNYLILDTFIPIIEKFKEYTSSKSYLLTIDTLLRLIKPLKEYVRTTLEMDKFLAENPDFVRKINQNK